VAKSGLSLPQIEGGRVFRAGLSIGAELAGQRVETRVNAGWGWGVSAVVGADLAVTSAIAVGPFVRLDFIGSAMPTSSLRLSSAGHLHSALR
jgi:hypothetical protein